MFSVNTRSITSPSAFTEASKLEKAQMDTSCPRRMSSRPNTR